MDEDLAHGGGESAFIGLAAGQEPSDIGSDDRVELRGGSRCHEENATDFGTPAVDGALAGRLAAVVVERRYSCQGDELVAAESGDLWELCQQGPGGDVSNAFDRCDDLAVSFEVRRAIDQGADVLFDT